MINRLKERGNLLAFLIYAGLAVVWWSESFLSGSLPLAEFGHAVTWGDWLSSRFFLKGLGVIPEWNPNFMAGFSYLGQDPFKNPLSPQNIFMFLFSDPRLEWAFITALLVTLMAWGMFRFLREMNVRFELALLGGVIFMMLPKWPDDIYHGPRFAFAYSLLPWMMILIHRIFTRGQRPHHFILLGLCLSAAYVGSGGAVLFFIGELFIPYFLYMLLLQFLEQKENRVRLLGRVAAWAPVLGVMFVGLSAYLLFPFWGTYSWFDQRMSLSALGQTGFDWKWYFGLVFPWVSRIYGGEFYDTPYPSPFGDNTLQFLNILLIPVIILAIRHKIWDRRMSFFLVLPLAWMFFLSKWVTEVFPIVTWIELRLHALSTYNHGYMVYLFGGTVFLCWALQQLLDRSSTVWSQRGPNDRLTSAVNFGLIGLYAGAAALFVGGYILVHTPLWNLFADRYLGFSQNLSVVTPRLYLLVRLLFYYYFDSGFFWFFLLFFLAVIAQVWLFHKNYLSRRWGLIALVLMAALSYQAHLRVVYPFSPVTEARYGNSSYQNQFVLETVQPTERVGGNGIGIIWHNWTPRAQAIMSDPRYLTAPIEQVRQEAREILFDGYFEPLLDVPLSYYPVTVGKNSFNEHSSFMPDYWLDFYKSINRGERFEKGELAAQSFNFESLYNPSSKLLDVAGIKYLFWSTPLEDQRYKKVGAYQIGSQNTFYIYENQNAVPKAYLVRNVEYFPDREAALERLNSASFDPRASAVTEDDGLARQLGGGPAGGTVSGTVDVTEYGANRVGLKATASDQAVLVLDDMFYPFWSARVDGTPTEIFRVNVAFRGIILPPGTHSVEFEFRNPLFHNGIYVTAGTSVIVLGALAWLFFYERRRSRTQDGG